MSRLSNFMTEKLMNVAKLRNADGYENMSRQYLENIFTMPSVSIPKAISIFTSEPRARPTIKCSPIPIPRPSFTLEPLPFDMDKFEKMEMEKTQSILDIKRMVSVIFQSL